MWQTGKFLRCVSAAAVCALSFLLISLLSFSALPEGEKVYYLYSPSSQAEIKKELSPADLFYVTGESVSFSVPEGTEEAFAQKVVEAYGAEICFCEEACGILSYYCYSPRLKGGITLGGGKVNLHVAAAKGRVAVGNPIIFGGY